MTTPTNATLGALFDISTPMDILFNLYTIVQLLTGGLFVYVLVTLPFIASWLISKNVVLPTIIYLAVGSALVFLLPWEMKGIALYMLSFAGAGMIYSWFKEKN